MNKYHELMIDKGFHDGTIRGADGLPTPIQRIAYCGLILSESPEIEQDLFYTAVRKDPGKLPNEARAWYIASSGKPVGFLSEFADVWIRCADVLGACHEPLEGGVHFLPEYLTGNKHEDQICKVLGIAVESARRGLVEEYASWIRLVMELSREGAAFWAKALRVTELIPSFDDAIEIKHTYNTTRPKRHGKLA